MKEPLDDDEWMVRYFPMLSRHWQTDVKFVTTAGTAVTIASMVKWALHHPALNTPEAEQSAAVQAARHWLLEATINLSRLDPLFAEMIEKNLLPIDEKPNPDKKP